MNIDTNILESECFQIISILCHNYVMWLCILNEWIWHGQFSHSFRDVDWENEVAHCFVWFWLDSVWIALCCNCGTCVVAVFRCTVADVGYGQRGDAGWFSSEAGCASTYVVASYGQQLWDNASCMPSIDLHAGGPSSFSWHHCRCCATNAR